MNSKTTLTKRKNVLAAMVGLFAAAGGASSAMAQGDEVATEQGRIDEIIITARKRAESLQDVPLAVTAITGVDISHEGVESVSDLYGRVPGLFFSTFGNPAGPTSDFTYLIIRGVGFNSGNEPPTGVFIDGMYQPQLGFDIGFLDLERLEVLRGPQGTLFGRNTQGGALNLVTKKPEESLSGKIEAEMAEFGTRRLFGRASAAITDTVYGGVTAEYTESDGFVKNKSTGTDQNFHERYSIRSTLRWMPKDDLELLFSADISRKDYSELGQGVPFLCGCFEAFGDNEQDDVSDNSGLQLTTKWDFSKEISLTSITGWRQVESDIALDMDGINTSQELAVIPRVPGSALGPDLISVAGYSHRMKIKQDFFSEEIRLTGLKKSMDWLVGLYYFDQSQNQQRFFDIGNNVNLGPVLGFLSPLYLRENLDLDRNGWAIFGQASWELSDRVEFTLGGRYTNENVETDGEGAYRLDLLDLNVLFSPDAEDTFTNFSPMASISYDVTDSSMLYFTVSAGWKAGGFNRIPSDQNISGVSFDSESSTNWELGYKGNLLDERVSANLAIFQVDISDQQFVQTLLVNNLPVRTIGNASEGRSRGTEFELDVEITERLNISSSFAYVNGEYTDFIQENGGFSLDRGGDKFEYVPEITASATVNYSVALGNSSELDFYLHYRYIDSIEVVDTNALAPLGATLKVPNYERLDLRLSYIRDTWGITGYVTNLLDSYDITNALYTTDRVPGSQFATPLAPRQIGLKVSKDF